MPLQAHKYGEGAESETRVHLKEGEGYLTNEPKKYTTVRKTLHFYILSYATIKLKLLNIFIKILNRDWGMSQNYISKKKSNYSKIIFRQLYKVITYF